MEHVKNHRAGSELWFPTSEGHWMQQNVSTPDVREPQKCGVFQLLWFILKNPVRGNRKPLVLWGERPTWRSGVVGEARFTSWKPSRVSALLWPPLQAMATALRHHTLCRHKHPGAGWRLSMAPPTRSSLMTFIASQFFWPRQMCHFIYFSEVSQVWDSSYHCRSCGSRTDGWDGGSSPSEAGQSTDEELSLWVDTAVDLKHRDKDLLQFLCSFLHFKIKD